MGEGGLKKERPAGGKRYLEKKINDLVDHLLDDLNPYYRIKRSITFKNNTIRCGAHKVVLKKNSRIIVVGGGKAVIPMAQAIYDIFGYRVHGQINYHRDLGRIPPIGDVHVQPAGHPNPDEGSLQGSRAIIGKLRNSSPDDIVFSLISGGGSAMLELPVPEIDLKDYIIVNDLLNRTGIDIEKWNIVRKHLSKVKGGKLARFAAHTAKVFNLMVSDVKDDRPDIIASGPFTIDSSTFRDAYEILADLHPQARALGVEIPISVLTYLRNRQGTDSKDSLENEPKNLVHKIIASNNTAIDMAGVQLNGMGIADDRICYLRNISGEVSDVSINIYSALESQINRFPKEPSAVIAGGEATVDVSRYSGFRMGESYGGRMQMMAALMMPRIDNLPVTGLFLATDCRDGTSPPGKPASAGAIINGNSLKKCREKKISWQKYINQCNSYQLHYLLSSQLRKETFFTNVRDLVVLVYWP